MKPLDNDQIETFMQVLAPMWPANAQATKFLVHRDQDMSNPQLLFEHAVSAKEICRDHESKQKGLCLALVEAGRKFTQYRPFLFEFIDGRPPKKVEEAK